MFNNEETYSGPRIETFVQAVTPNLMFSTQILSQHLLRMENSSLFRKSSASQCQCMGLPPILNCANCVNIHILKRQTVHIRGKICVLISRKCHRITKYFQKKKTSAYDCKSIAQAETHRKDGNLHFVKKRNKEALECYNKVSSLLIHCNTVME